MQEFRVESCLSLSFLRFSDNWLLIWLFPPLFSLSLSLSPSPFPFLPPHPLSVSLLSYLISSHLISLSLSLSLSLYFSLFQMSCLLGEAAGQNQQASSCQPLNLLPQSPPPHGRGHDESFEPKRGGVCLKWVCWRSRQWVAEIRHGWEILYRLGRVSIMGVISDRSTKVDLIACWWWCNC